MPKPSDVKDMQRAMIDAEPLAVIANTVAKVGKAAEPYVRKAQQVYDRAAASISSIGSANAANRVGRRTTNIELPRVRKTRTK